MEGKGDNIIRVTNTRGVTIKVFTSETNRCTRGINKIGEKTQSRGLKNSNPCQEDETYDQEQVYPVGFTPPVDKKDIRWHHALKRITQHSTTDHDNIQLGGGASPMYLAKYFFSLLLFFEFAICLLKK
jgi:hypothetical protein